MKTKPRKFVSILLALVAVFSLITFAPAPAHAATGPVTINVATLTNTKQDNLSAVATESQWSYSYSDGAGRLSLGTSAPNSGHGNYTLVGTNDNIRVYVPYSGSNIILDHATIGNILCMGTNTITLDNTKITNPDGFTPGDGTVVTLIGANSIDSTLQGGSGLSVKNATITSGTYGTLTVKGPRTGMFISGFSTLNIAGNAAIAIDVTGNNAISGYSNTGIAYQTINVGPNAKLSATGGRHGISVVKDTSAPSAYVCQLTLNCDGIAEINSTSINNYGIYIPDAKLCITGSGNVSATAGYSGIYANEIEIKKCNVTAKSTGGYPISGLGYGKSVQMDKDAKLTLIHNRTFSIKIPFARLGDLDYGWKLTNATTSDPVNVSPINIALPAASGGSFQTSIIERVKNPPPNAPTGVSATAGNGQATVAFTPPALNGNTVTGYTVTSSPGNIKATDTDSPITVTGLTNGTAYTFTVTATNVIGTSVPSAASNSVTPSAVTTTPTPTFALTVNNGKGGGSFAAGAKVTITANAAPAGQVFDKWTGGSGGTFANANSVSTTFTMPAKAADVTATYKPVASVANVTKIDIPQKTVYIQKGKSLTIPFLTYDGSNEIKTDLTWKSANESVAKVTQTGTITGVKKGTAKITATAANGKQLSITVNVSDKAVKLKSAKVTAPTSLKVGKTKKLTLTLAPKNATGLKITFKSSKPAGLYVDKTGLLTAKKAGTYTVTIKVGTTTVKKTIKVAK